MNIQDIIKNQDILDCWKEIQKSNIDKNISKEVFEYDIEEYHTFLLDEIIEASQYMNISFDALINEMFSFVKDNKSLLINFSNERLNKKIPFSSQLSYEEMSTGYTEEELGISYKNLEDETNAIIDIGTLLTYLIDLIFLFKEEKNYMKYLTQRLYYSEIHAKEFIDYEKNIIENLSSK
ncbi:hypothetical protein KST80_06035 [Fusobacterium polymorphum]|uniref:Uncharacterized protein n=1 Tax=Fusobacterium nucleatum subsp. polymorphum TaxID=76857 RepID=A0A246EEF3_FUSNP|nr:hypothetical protein [Fusobacterium polymorphum]OWP25042.1 hypothetical protein CA839_03315 [Fusobacterium polymorphum]PHI13760.1 hypothetical protein CBG59_08750 [Fusobacterium polymorphum]PHI15824.1 hypothetical protein CBG58_01555 [Fusobacterium polymorphum]